MYFLNHPITISSIAEKFLNFISRVLIFAKNQQKKRNHEIYPRKVLLLPYDKSYSSYKFNPTINKIAIHLSCHMLVLSV